MPLTSEEKIKKVSSEISSARSPKQKCGLLIDLAMELRHSDSVSALKHVQEALAITEEIDFVPGRARCYFCMALIQFGRSNYEQALICLDQAHSAYVEAGDRWGSSNVQNNIGLIYLRMGDYVKALEHFSSALEMKKNSGDRFGTANVMINMATIHRESGNLESARVLLDENLAICEELKSESLITKALMELGTLLIAENKFSEAAEKFERAKIIFEKSNNFSGLAACFLQLGKICSSMGSSDDAIALFERGKRMTTESGDKSLTTTFLINIASEKLKNNERKEALRFLMEAREIAGKTQEKPSLMMIARTLSSLYEGSGNLKEALAEYRDFVSLKDEIHSVETSTRLRNQQISAKVDALKQENKILEVEKMAVVGQLTAGVAHEINNPVNFIASNILPVKKNISDLLSLLERYEEILVEIPENDFRKGLEQLRYSLDIDVAIKETQELLEGIQSGAIRIREIVNALQVITRLNEESLKISDIHTEIDAVLTLLQNKIGTRISVGKEYGVVAPFEHFPSKFSQAVMNIIENAVEAITGDGQISIRTFEENSTAHVVISDSGKGISDSVKRKIYDPFFTTKDVGMGLGLGLTTALSIIEQHHGLMKIDSVPSKGTVVEIILPLRQ